jgi:AAHS family 3-hydroxyphenylpropionic acid transporter
MAMQVDAKAGGGSATAGRTVALCGLVAAFEGFDLQAAGVAAPRLAPFFQMTPDQLGWFFSASTFGLMLGAAVGGRLSDWMGRKRVLILSVLLFGLFSIATGLSDGVEGLLLFRFLTGVGLGGALPNVIALVAENTSQARRFTSLGVLYAGLPTGGSLASLVTVFGGGEDWRLVFFAGGFAPVLCVPLLMLFLPDSRQFAEAKAKDAPRLGLGAALFGEGRATRTLVLWVGFFFALLTMYILLNWLPTMLVSKGLTRPEASMVQIGFNVAGAIGSVVTGLLMDSMPRRLVTPVTFVLTIVCIYFLSIAPGTFGVSLVAGALIGATVSGTQAILYALAPGAYPTAARGGGVGVAVSVGRFGSAAGPLLAGLLLAAGQSPRQVLFVLLPALAVAGVGAFVVALSSNPKAEAVEPA